MSVASARRPARPLLPTLATAAVALLTGIGPAPAQQPAVEVYLGALPAVEVDLSVLGVDEDAPAEASGITLHRPEAAARDNVAVLFWPPLPGTRPEPPPLPVAAAEPEPAEPVVVEGPVPDEPPPAAEPEAAVAEPEAPAEPEVAATEPEAPAEPEVAAAEPETPAEPEVAAPEPEPLAEPEVAAVEPETPAEPEAPPAEAGPEPAEPEVAAAEPATEPVDLGAEPVLELSFTTPELNPVRGGPAPVGPSALLPPAPEPGPEAEVAPVPPQPTVIRGNTQPPPAPPDMARVDEVATAPVTGIPAPGETTTTLPGGEGFRILFDAGSEELTEAGGRLLSGIAEQLANDTTIRLQVRAYAGGTPETASQARRLSLNRALAVRSFLIDRGVIPTRIDVRALGNTASDEPRDRVDLLPTS